jgi:hypothetical protein
MIKEILLYDADYVCGIPLVKSGVKNYGPGLFSFPPGYGMASPAGAIPVPGHPGASAGMGAIPLVPVKRTEI